METAYDWITVGIFAGLIVLFMQRSTGAMEPENDALWKYLAAGVGCAVANYLGNDNLHIPAILTLALTVGFIFYSLRPFSTEEPH